MPDEPAQPTPVPVVRPIDDTAADAGSLEDMGVIPPQPTPGPQEPETLESEAAPTEPDPEQPQP
ncbi:hypothetical protein [Streptomyces sp. MJP52]|uniref:hypothetical protein n=1 Tax=Streptomyces sp. MJP52 TaxID=2940555 RepID=UPI0024741E6F|nr:hypothetical protein [Streptomyces sp. MJP52]MDH6224371.1 hypothetical protein [Streptomyces sp. MJP52]